MRARAARFADEWRDAAYEKGETQSFYNAFFEIFGVRRRSVARYEEHVRKLDNQSGFIDLFWPGVLIVEQKSAGRNLARAYGQAGEYFDSLSERARPRYILVSDFQTFELHDLDEGEHITFPLADLHDHVEEFGFILGTELRSHPRLRRCLKQLVISTRHQDLPSKWCERTNLLYLCSLARLVAELDHCSLVVEVAS